MFGLFGLIALALTVAPLVLATLAFRQSARLSTRIGLLERTVDDLAAAVRRVARGDDVAIAPAPAPVVTPAAAPPVGVASPPPSPPATSTSDGTAVPPSPPSTPIAAPLKGPSAPGFEERLGTRWAVWTGGAALAIGGLFLVRYSIEAGLLGPGVRVILGALLALALLAAGEWLRRADLKVQLAMLPQAHIPSVLTAAGTIIAFGTIYAAHALYGFIGPTLAFVLLGATALLALVGAALHGPWLAGLGLIGAYATPILISSDTSNPWPVVLYLAVVATAAYALARLRQWLWLAVAAVVGACAWGLLLTPSSPASVAEFGRAAQIFVLSQLLLAAFFLAIEPHARQRDADATPDRVATLALSALAAVAGVVIAAPDMFVWGAVPFALAIIAIFSACAWRSAPAAVSALLAGAVGMVAILAWPDLAVPPEPTLTAPDRIGLLRLPDNVAQFFSFATLAALIPSLVAGYRLWRGPLLPPSTAMLYGAATVLPILVALALAYLRVTQFDTSIPFALVAALLTIGFAIAAEAFHRADTAYSAPAFNIGAGSLATGAIAALSLALVMSLERGYLTVALALTAAGAATIARQRDIPALRWAVAGLGLIVLGRVGYDPRIMGGDVGTTPILNWLLLGYGVPALAFWFAARQLEPRGTDLALRLADSLAVIFAGLLAFFEIRHLTNSGDVLAPGSGHVEAGLQTFVALAISFAVARMTASRANRVFDVASLAFGVIALSIAALGLAVVFNPALTGEAVTGTPLFGSLLVGYALPGLAALFVARHTRLLRPGWYVRAAGCLGVGLLTLYATLAVRQSFQGSSIDIWHLTSDAEHWSYSAVWLTLGIAFLGYGLLRGSLEARAASAGLIVLAALKVTLFDLAGIGGIWRALSFLFLGAVLIGIGLVYQRLIFARPAPPPA